MPLLRFRTMLFLPVGGVFFMVGVGFSIWAVRTWRSEHQFDGAAVTNGVVEKAWGVRQGNRGNRGRSDAHYVRCRYVVNGKTYVFDQFVGRQFFNTVSRGDTIPIYYLESNPAVAVAEKRHLNVFLFIFAIPFSLIGGGMLLASVPNALSVMTFNASAVATNGTVVSLNEYPLISNGYQTWTVQYAFRDAEGNEHRAFSDPIPEPDTDQFESGTAVRVRYKRNDPETSELDFPGQVTED
jgi:hypothetical protein